MYTFRNKNLLVIGLILLFALCTLPNPALAVTASDTDTVEVTLTIPLFMGVMLANEGGDGSLTEMDNLSWSPSEQDMIDEVVFEASPHGYVHTWSNDDIKVMVDRTNNDFGAAGLHLWMHADAWSYFEVTTSEVLLWAAGPGHSNVNVHFEVRGLDWATPEGTHTETVTVTIYQDV